MSTADLVVATYNLWGYGEPWDYTARRGESRGAAPGSPAATLRPPEGVWPRRRRLLAGALGQIQADVVGLQEVCCEPATGVSQADEVARDLAYHVAFQPIATSDYGAGPCAAGLALLSRWPIRHCQEVALPAEPGAGQAAMHGIVAFPSGPFDVLVVHLTTRNEPGRLATAVRREGLQVAGARHLLAYLDTLPAKRPAIVLGDFNSEPESAPIQALTRTPGGRKALRDAWRAIYPEDPGLTMPSQAPVIRIDYIFLGPGLTVVSAMRLGNEPDAEGFYSSDHLGVAAGLRFQVGGPV